MDKNISDEMIRGLNVVRDSIVDCKYKSMYVYAAYLSLLAQNIKELVSYNESLEKEILSYDLNQKQTKRRNVNE